MPVTPDFRLFVVEQLGRIAPVSSRPMFGGVGIYSDGFFFALIDDDRIYFKVDDSNREDFVAAGKGPFAPFGDAKPMQYYELPGELIEDTAGLAPWVEKAIQVARNAKRKKKK